MKTESYNLHQTEKLYGRHKPRKFSGKQILERAYAHAKSSGYTGTDDASLVEYLGESVSIVEGSYNNFKITYPADIKYAEMLITGDV